RKRPRPRRQSAVKQDGNSGARTGARRQVLLPQHDKATRPGATFCKAAGRELVHTVPEPSSTFLRCDGWATRSAFDRVEVRPVNSAKLACVLGLSIVAAMLAVDGRAVRAASEPAAAARSAAESVYAAAPPRLLQIRTLVADAGRQTSIGSGFLVSADG